MIATILTLQHLQHFMRTFRTYQWIDLIHHKVVIELSHSWKRQWLPDEEKWEGMEHNFSTIKLKGIYPDQYPGFED